ncbi:cache domain-containing protein [Marinobacterium rhizophilum]|uniref:histidine kinase n=1 Tax=Marinobacterium rhizophilum TaxID=420402 RepID=A0ABY5HIK9_9GAMM|nr:cache domain-containing protein [Marinobacterium rhizophilum]UTW12207.1 cache domain-containing protein [Marinobacterium rhizophilum]
MLPGSKLTRRFFTVIALIIAAIFLAFYAYSVPLIQKKVFEIERNNSRTTLNNIFELASQMHVSVEDYRKRTLNAHEQRLKAVVALTAMHIDESLAQARRLNIPPEQARARLFERLRSFSYGRGDYVWIADYDSTLLSHPEAALHNRSALNLRDSEGNSIIPEIVALAMQEGEGFYRYKWHRLGETRSLDKFSYVRNFPDWGFVIGAGVYLDDIDAEVQQQTAQALQKLRSGLLELRIAETGYMYVFDGDGNMLIHPNANLDGTNFLDLLNPTSGRSIAADLMDIAASGEELYYQWDKPSDPGHYSYEKVALVRYLPGFDWYIGSSVYVDELRSSSEVLTDRILTMALIAMLAAILLAFIFVHWVTRPIRRLSETAERVSDGELGAKSGISRDDELGVLARAFDRMVDQLRGNIHTLDAKVQARTRDLEASNRQLLGAVASMQQAQQELRTHEARQRLILDALPAQIAYIDSNMHYVFVNQGYADVFDRSKDDIVGRHPSEILGEQMFADIHQQIERTLAGEESVYEYRIQREDREMITKRMLIPFHSADDEVNGLLNLSLDITAEKEAERTLNEAQRMSAVGQLAGGLAHDFNNLLSILLGNLMAMRDNPALNDALLRYLNPAIRATRRGADITRRLLAFSRRQPLKPSAVPLPGLISDLAELLAGPLPNSIRIDYRCAADAPQPFVDAGQLEDALVNLALNARDAMPDGGTLSFEVCGRHVSAPLTYDEPVLPGDYVEIRVRDTGHGFSSEAACLAFEPFFTTKTGGAGSGLGLSMVYGFVKQSRGYIQIQSALEQGSVISLLLPASVPAQLPAREMGNRDGDEAADDGQNKLILLVEDNPDVRQVVREQLIALGYNVIEASGADEASLLINSLEGLHGMVCDIIMPGSLNGFELARQLYDHTPGSRIVLMSGYSYEQDPGDNSDHFFTMLPKPFEQDALRAALRRESLAKQSRTATGLTPTPQ